MINPFKSFLTHGPPNRNRTERASPFNSFTTTVTEKFVVQKKHKVRF